MTEQTTATRTYPVVDGALTDVPTHDSHRRAKNWLALIEADPRSPSGLSRRFCEKAHGAYYYMLGSIKRGDALEFGADYYTGGAGKKHPHRKYAAVAAVSEDALELALFDSPREAFEAAEAIMAQDAPSAASQLEAPETDLAQRLAGLSAERARLVVEASEEMRKNTPAADPQPQEAEVEQAGAE